MMLQDIADLGDTADRTIGLFFIGVLFVGTVIALFWLLSWLWGMFGADLNEQADIDDDISEKVPDDEN